MFRRFPFVTVFPFTGDHKLTPSTKTRQAHFRFFIDQPKETARSCLLFREGNSPATSLKYSCSLARSSRP
ncbi:hypothetical protein KC19_10G184300 [Ceratodon purpureus]|uniref:Uncharacterized protein n=1 Tax=Ceratodon purpureus TaxID=3225 RepID=A0A8T0GLR8_CERPU|nr:hypothetical protein KC19_10G184300 [Ceratodon purpureus]